MGLSVDRLTGLLRIDRSAIPDRALAASDKYDTTKTAAAKQSIRLCVSVDGKGNSVFEDFDFDLSQKGLKTMMMERPELYAMYEVTKTYLLSQPGMAMKQPTVKPTKIGQPTTRMVLIWRLHKPRMYAKPPLLQRKKLQLWPKLATN